MDQKTAMLNELKLAIERWLKGKKTRSLSMLAHRTNKAYSTIRYIAQGERLPSESTIFAITDVIMETAERVSFFKTYFPEMGELMEKAYPPEIRSQPHHEMLQRFLRQEPHNRIFNMAATEAGTNRNRVRTLLGDVGIQALQDMLDEGLLSESERGVVKYSSESWALTNIDDTLAQLSASIHHFDRGLVGTDGAALVHMTASISPSHIPRLKKLISEFAKELSKLKNDPDAKGEIPFFCNLLYSLYDKNLWGAHHQGDQR